jgi:hypothetical protein
MYPVAVVLQYNTIHKKTQNNTYTLKKIHNVKKYTTREVEARGTDEGLAERCGDLKTVSLY